MQINDLSSLLSQVEEGDMWESITDLTSEMYIEKGAQYTIRSIGPAYKASRCYIGRDNAISRQLTIQGLKTVLRGNPVNVKGSQYPQASVREMEIACNKGKWSKCLITTAILLQNNGNYLKNNRLYYVAIPSSAVYDLIQTCQKRDGICLSGVMAHDITLRKESRAPFATSVVVSDEASFLPKKAMNHILSEGLRDAKEFFVTTNQRNLSRKHGFFCCFNSDKKSSVLDKHLEPIQQLKNYIEEDRQYRHIEKDHTMMSELEGAPLVDFIDIE
jgi:hypothetical protein